MSGMYILYIATAVLGLVLTGFYLLRCRKYSVSVNGSVIITLFLLASALLGGFALMVSLFLPEVRNIPKFDEYVFIGGLSMTVYVSSKIYGILKFLQ
ncbi:MAG: hypothetical protein ACR2NQ_00925 [Thermodesulfobacteriota bacterium]